MAGVDTQRIAALERRVDELERRLRRDLTAVGEKAVEAAVGRMDESLADVVEDAKGTAAEIVAIKRDVAELTKE